MDSSFARSRAVASAAKQEERFRKLAAGRIKRAEAASVSGIWVTCTDGTKAARLAGPYIAAGDEVYLGNVSDNPRRPAWVCFGPIGEAKPRILTGQGFVDLATIAAGAVGTGTITVPGAAAGDVALVSASSQIEAGLTFKQAWVSGDNTVTFAIINISSGSINPSGRSWYARVIKA